MSQTWSAPQNSQSAKAIDYALVISGWPTIYTVARTYSPLPASGSNVLSTAEGFADTKAWASVPRILGIRALGRPEEGSTGVAHLEIDLVDHIDQGKRSITHLFSREAEIQDPAGFPRTYLKSSVGPGDDILWVDTTAGFPSQGVAFVGLECVKYTGIVGLPSLPRLTGCERGYRLTAATGHEAGAGVYSFMPSLFWRRAFVFKGYQDLALDSWVSSFGGLIAGMSRQGARVTLSIFDTRWMADARGTQLLLGPGSSASSAGVFRPAVARDNNENGLDVDGTEEIYGIDIQSPHHLEKGHHLMNLGGNWFGIKEAT